MAQKLSNNASSTLLTAITSGSTSLVLAAGGGAAFPSPTGGDYFLVTVENGSNREIIKITARSSDTLTTSAGNRAQESTTAQSFAAGSTVELRVTAGTLTTMGVQSMWANVKEFGATGDGTTDDTTALTNAIASGKDVVVPAGIYLITTALTLANQGQKIIGTRAARVAADVTNGSIIRTSGSINALSITAPVQIENLVLDGANAGAIGITIAGGNRSHFKDVVIKRFLSDGVRVPSGTANNNLMTFEACAAYSNGGHGFNIVEDASGSADNNGPLMLGCEANANTSDGLRYSGQGLVLIGGIYSSNGAYGIRLGVSTDAGSTKGCVVLYPWVESNTTGGVLSDKAVGNLIYLDSNQQGHVHTSGSGDLHIRATTGAMEIVDDAVNATLRNLVLTGYAANANQVQLILRKARGTAATPVLVNSSDFLGAIEIGGHTGAAFNNSAIQIVGVASEAWNTTQQGSHLRLSTTTAGSATLVERMRIGPGVQIGTPTGTDKGAGTLNLAAAPYVNNVRLPSSFFSGTLGVATIAASTTTYGGQGSESFNTTEANRVFMVPRAGTMRDFYVRTNNTQPASGSLVATIRRNAADTSIAATVAAGAAFGTVSNVANTATCSAGDFLALKFVNNATGTSAQVSGFGFAVDPI
jgi:hypothetical protein